MLDERDVWQGDDIEVLERVWRDVRAAWNLAFGSDGGSLPLLFRAHADLTALLNRLHSRPEVAAVYRAPLPTLEVAIPDGPVNDGVFWFEGKCYSFTPGEFALLSAVWKSLPAGLPLGAARDVITPPGKKRRAEKSARAVVLRLGERFDMLGLPFFVNVVHGRVVITKRESSRSAA